MCNTPGGFIEYTGGYHQEYTRGVQYTGRIPRWVWRILWWVWGISWVHQKMFSTFSRWSSPTFIVISHRCTEHPQCTHDIPWCIKHPPMYCTLPDMASDNATVVCKSNKKRKLRRKKKIRRDRHGKAGTKAHVGICNILYANVNGFRSKCESIKQILVEENVDVLLLTETKVYKNSAIHCKWLSVICSCQKQKVWWRTLHWHKTWYLSITLCVIEVKMLNALQ